MTELLALLKAPRKNRRAIRQWMKADGITYAKLPDGTRIFKSGKVER